MADLKVTLAGVEHTAPAPRVAQFKAYLKFLRAGERARADGSDADIDEEFVFIASLFCDPAVTAQSMEAGLSFSEAARLRREYLPWLTQYMPEADAKNGKAR
mgnify:CR=1 FL=1